MDTKNSQLLTPAQIENWRNLLFKELGPYALLMPAEDIQAYRNRAQAMFETKKK